MVSYTKNPNWRRKYSITKFSRMVPCPYGCGQTCSTSLQLARHALRYHNFYNSEKFPVLDVEDVEALLGFIDTLDPKRFLIKNEVVDKLKQLTKRDVDAKETEK